jgi:hypothetical protein
MNPFQTILPEKGWQKEKKREKNDVFAQKNCIFYEKNRLKKFDSWKRETSGTRINTRKLFLNP